MASIFDKHLMSDSDRERVEELEKAWRDTTDTQKRRQLHNEAESIRRGYGYSGGDDGSLYEVTDLGTVTAAGAAKAYTDAVKKAENQRGRSYAEAMNAAERTAKDRLREAYIKNMRSTLGLDQKLRSSGLTGGIAESTRAAYDNDYLNERDSIYSDMQSAKTELAQKAAQSAYDSSEKAAKIGYDSAADRADRVTETEQRSYDRAADEQKRQLERDKFDYTKKSDADQLDYKNRQLEYQKQKDALDRSYQQQKDALELEYKRQSAAQAASRQANSANQSKIGNVLTLIKNGYYSPEFAEILGIDDLTKSASGSDSAADYAWKMLSKGVYDDSFPELLGISADILKKYAENVLAGY